VTVPHELPHELPHDLPDGPPSETLDARGLRCPLPVIRLAARAAELPPGALVTVLSTDPAACHDVPAWTRLRGHDFVGQERHEDAWALTVRLRAR